MSPPSSIRGVAHPATLALTLWLAGCGEAPAASIAETTSAVATIRARTGTQLAVADLVKPRMDGDAELDPYLAPLVYLETDGDAVGGVPGAVFVDEDGALRADATRPTVYFADEWPTLDGEERRQLSFVWFRAGALHATAQGLRVTHDAGGQPALVEVLDDSSGCRVVYAAEELDLDSAVEALVDADPPTVVAARFGLGPVPTGPYVYLAHDSNDVVAVHCRCQPTQATETRELIEYELLPLDALQGVWPDAGGAAGSSSGFGPPERAFEVLSRD